MYNSGFLSDLEIVDGYLFWCICSGHRNIPSLYNISNDKIIEFDTMPSGYYLKSNEICIFKY